MWGWNLPHHEFKRVNPKLSASQQEQTCLPPLILSFSPILFLAPPSPPPPFFPPFSSVQGSCSYTKMIFMILFHLFIFCWEDGVNRCSRLLKHMQTCMEIRYIKELIQSLFHTTGGNFVYMKKLDLIWNLIWFITSNYKKYMITSCVFFLHWIRIWGDFVFTSMAHCKEKPNKCFLWVGLFVVFCHFFLSVPFALKYLASILYSMWHRSGTSGTSGTRCYFKGFLCLNPSHCLPLIRWIVSSCLLPLFRTFSDDFIQSLCFWYHWYVWNKHNTLHESRPYSAHELLFDEMNCFQLLPRHFVGFPVSFISGSSVFRGDLHLFHLCQSCHMFFLKEYLPVMTSQRWFHIGWITPPLVGGCWQSQQWNVCDSR